MSVHHAKRIDFIDLLEFLAMTLVLLYHCTTYDFNILESASVSVLLGYYFRAILSAGVPLFFFANGYLLFSRESILKKHVHKTIRLIILTVIWGFINVLLLMPIEGQYLSGKAIIRAVWSWKSGWINHFWFLGVLICLHFIFPVLKTTFDTNKKAFYYFVTVCAVMTFGNQFICAAGTVAAHMLIGYPEQIKDNVFNMFNPFRGSYWWYALVYFCGGGIAHLLVPYIRAHQKKANWAAALSIPLSMLLLAVWGCFLSRLQGSVWDHVWGGYDSVFTLINVAAFFVLSMNYSSNRNIVHRFIELVSRNTLGIFFIHEIFIHLTHRQVNMMPPAQNIIGNIIYTAVILLVSLFSAMVIKSIPVLKKLLV